MYINNNSLFDNKCKICLYCEKKECLKPDWRIPSHDFCVSFRYQSNFTKASIISQENKTDGENISPHSSWGDIILSAPKQKNFDESSPSLSVAIAKKAQDFYNMIPSSLFYCENCELYFENEGICSECENVLNPSIVYLSDLEHFLSEYINYLLSKDDIPTLIKKVQYLTLFDINIMED